MKKLSNNLSLNKKSVQILDDKALIDLRGGALADRTCKEDSCKVETCGFASCNGDAVQELQ